MTNEFFKTKIKEAEKGCGKSLKASIGGNIFEFECGKWREISEINIHMKMLWCPLCAEKIIRIYNENYRKSQQAVKEALLKIKERIDNLREKITERTYRGSYASELFLELEKEINKIAKEYLGIDLSQEKKEVKTLSNLTSGDTKQDDKKLQIERSASLSVDNHPDTNNQDLEDKK